MSKLSIAKGLALLPFLVFAGGAVFAQDEEVNPDEGGAGEVFVDREGERCITTRSIRNTDVIDDYTILFEMRGGDYYVNNLRNRCIGLEREGRFSYRTSTGRLCSVSIVDVLRQFGGTLERGASCSLGEFYPITEEEADFLRGRDRRGGGPQMEVENPNEGRTTENESEEPQGQNDDATAL